MTGAAMAAEIAEQPAVLARLLAEAGPEVAAVAAEARRHRPHGVLLAARGTSDHAALYGKYLVETRLGLPAGLASPSTVTVYGARPRLAGVLAVAVSQSGASPDLVAWLAAARTAGAVTVAVTNAAGSPLAEAAALHVDVRAGAERSVAATKTFTAEMLALYLLVDALRGGDGRAAAGLPDAAAAALVHEDAVAVMADRLAGATQLLATARGYAYPVAREAALKLMETSYLPAHAFSGADLLHGPLAMLEPGFPVLAVAPHGPGGSALLPVLDRLVELRTSLLVVGGEEAARRTDAAVVLPAGVPEELAPVVAALPVQQLALAVARRRGHDPDTPRGLSKVTRTR